MATYDLDILLPDEDKVYQPGEEVSGVLHVKAHEDFRWDVLGVQLRWEAQGRGHVDSEEVAELSFDGGALSSGKLRKFPFALQIPEQGPIDYKGHHLTIGWHLSTGLIIDGQFHAGEERRVTVERASSREALEGDKPVVVFGPEDGERLRLLRAYGEDAFVFISMWVVAFVGLGIVATACYRAWQSDATLGLEFASFALFTSVVAFFSIRYAHKRLRKGLLLELGLGKVLLDMAPRALYPEELATVSITFSPRKKFELHHLKIIMVCEEVVISGVGSSAETHIYDVYREAADVATSKVIQPRERLRFDAQVSIREDAMHTFHSEHSELRWYVALQFEVPGWPMYERKRSFQVLS